eukprot:scaffold19996_cov64-Phaeocystis_antarctica.AAC.1
MRHRSRAGAVPRGHFDHAAARLVPVVAWQRRVAKLSLHLHRRGDRRLARSERAARQQGRREQRSLHGGVWMDAGGGLVGEQRSGHTHNPGLPHIRRSRRGQIDRYYLGEEHEVCKGATSERERQGHQPRVRQQVFREGFGARVGDTRRAPACGLPHCTAPRAAPSCL